MDSEHDLEKPFEKLRKDLQHFIDLSIEKNDKSWQDWILSIYKKIDAKCWKEKDCKEFNCPAYRNECGRCWLIAGTMCSCEVQGKFSKMYKSCQKCAVYREAIYQSPLHEAEEHLIILIHSLRTKHHELKELATTDFLTGVHNRRFFDIFIESKMEEIKRTKLRLFLILIDINDFKRINDKHGHLYGDNVLKECAKIFRDVTRKVDAVIRFGGDEFLIISQDDRQNDNTAAHLIDRIERKIYHWNDLHKGTEIILSLSYGDAIITHGSILSVALKEADMKMYQDKKEKQAKSLQYHDFI